MEDSWVRQVAGIGLAVAIPSTVYAVTGGDWLKAILSFAGVAACLLWGFWPDIRRLVRGDGMVPAGFSLQENQLFQEGATYGVRIRLRPKGVISDALLCFYYDASLTIVRWRIEGNPEGPLPRLEVPLAERETGNEAARAVEIRLEAPPSLTPATDVIFEFIGPVPVRITRIERLS